MTQYDISDVKLSHSHLNKLIRNKNALNVIGNSNYETNFPYKLLLIHTQVSRLGKTFANNLSALTKSVETRLSQMVHLERF